MCGHFSDVQEKSLFTFLKNLKIRLKIQKSCLSKDIDRKCKQRNAHAFTWLKKVLALKKRLHRDYVRGMKKIEL
jgi:hypothetical protein